MKGSPRILFISAYHSTFVLKELQLLKNNFRVKAQFFPKASKKNIFYLCYTFLRIFLGTINSDVIYVLFADLRAYFAAICCRLLKKKLMVQIGGYESAAIPELNYGGMLKKGQARRFRYILNKADLILTNSEFSQREVLSVEPVDKIVGLPLGIEAITQETDRQRERIVTIGNAMKNVWQLKGLDTFARATVEFPEKKAVIIGKCDPRIRSKLLKINPKLEFTGLLDNAEVIRMLQRTRVYCQLSRRESFGLALLEAMQCGAIPVITGEGSLPEVAGETGFYTEYGNVELTVQAIKAAWQKGSIDKVRNRAQEHFSLKLREEKLIQLVNKL